MELYLHIPFCIRKCDYCDFLSFPCDGIVRGNYLYALKQEMAAVALECKGEQISSVFIGGGTPSILNEGEIASLMEMLQESFSLEEGCEITMEANPGTLTPAKLREYLDCGINRLSIGCQSTVDRELRDLGRIHTFQDFQDNFYRAREVGFTNLNVDLMSAIPGQTVESWENNLRTIADLQPEHISAYSLIVEEGTPFYNRELNLPKEDAERQMYEMTGKILKEYGYHQYEISNYCRPGYECRHNVGYWRRVSYIGLGLGAASLYRNRRFSNTDNMEEYLAGSHALKAIRRNVETLSQKDAMEEFMFLGLRMIEGISCKEFAQTFGCDIQEVYGKQIGRMMQLRLLKWEGDNLCLTEMGIAVSNQVFVEFLLE